MLVPAGIGRNLFVAIPPCCAAPYVQFFVWFDSFLFLFFLGLVFPDSSIGWMFWASDVLLIVRFYPAGGCFGCVSGLLASVLSIGWVFWLRGWPVSGCFYPVTGCFSHVRRC